MDVRRVCVGLRRRAADEPAGVGSLPRTLAARPWTADQEFPQRPESVEDVSRVALDAWTPADLKKADGAKVALAGDAVLEAIREPALEAKPSLSSVAYMSSSTEINRRVRGRRVEVLLEVDNEEPLVVFMACGVDAVELHGPGERADWKDALL